MPPTKRRKRAGRGGKIVAKGGVKKGARAAAKRAAKRTKIEMERIFIKQEEVCPREENTGEVLVAYDTRSAPYADMPTLGMGELTEAQDLRRQLDQTLIMLRTFEKQAALDKRVMEELMATKERLIQKEQELAGTRDELTITREEGAKTKVELETKSRMFDKLCKESKGLLLRAEFAEAEHFKLIDQKPKVANFAAITEQMQTRIDEANAELAAMKMEKEKLTDNITTLKTEKKKYDEVVAKLKKENEEVKKERKDKDMRKAEGAVFKGSAALQQDVDRLRRERNMWMDEADREKQKNKVRESFLNDQAKLQKEKDQWQLDWANLKKEYEKLEGKLKEAKREITELKEVKREHELLRSVRKHESSRSCGGSAASSSSDRTPVMSSRRRSLGNLSPSRSSATRTPAKSSRRD